MKPERFYQLWEALVTGRPQGNGVMPIPLPRNNGIRRHTMAALEAYGRGDTTIVNNARAKFKALNK